MGCVYKITNLVSLKVYVGKTTRDMMLRFEEHLKDAERTQIGYKLHEAIKKYGRENFSIAQLACSDSLATLNKLEIYFIAKYKSMSDEYGYNMTSGGDGLGSGSQHPLFGTKNEKAGERMKAMMKDRQNPMQNEEVLNKHWRGENHPIHRHENVRNALKMGHVKLKRRVLKVCPNTGRILKMYPSIAEAARKTGGDVSNCVKGNQKTAAGFMWVYREEVSNMAYRRKQCW